MGFFPNIFKVKSADIVPNIVTGGLYSVSKEGLKVGTSLVSSTAKAIVSQVATPRPGASQSSSPFWVPSSPSDSQPSYSANYGAPSYGDAGGFGQNAFQPQLQDYNPWGVQSWGSSTTYSTPSAPSFQVYSAPPQPQGRTWEDLALAALPFFL